MTSMIPDVIMTGNMNELEVNTTGIIDELELSTTRVTPEDYPEIFRNPNKLYAHPDDYKVDDSPMTPQVFLYKEGVRRLLYLRISLKLTEDNDSKFTTATFLLDTGACHHMCLCPALVSLLKGRIHMEDAGLDFIKTDIGGERVHCDIKKEQLANVMMLFLMGLSLLGRISSFTFQDSIAVNVASQSLEYI